MAAQQSRDGEQSFEFTITEEDTGTIHEVQVSGFFEFLDEGCTVTAPARSSGSRAGLFALFLGLGAWCLRRR